MAKAKTTAGATETIESAVEQGAQAFEAGAEKVREGFQKVAADFEKYASFQKENLNALIEAAGAAGRGVEKLQAQYIAFAKASSEEFATAAKAIFGAGSLKAAMEAQSNYAKSAYEAYAAEMQKVREIMTDVAKDATAPLKDRSKAFFKFPS